VGHPFCRRGGDFCLFFYKTQMKSRRNAGDFFNPFFHSCKMNDEDSQFNSAVTELIKAFVRFRSWIDGQKKINVAFMKSYKKQLEDDIGPTVKAFEKKYQYKEEGQSSSYRLIMKGFACFERPIAFMQTRLRPSVGMGIFLERWMLTSAVREYLTQCCQEADAYLAELTNKMGPKARKIHGGGRKGKNDLD
jgi:hypothetical protein